MSSNCDVNSASSNQNSPSASLDWSSRAEDWSIDSQPTPLLRREKITLHNWSPCNYTSTNQYFFKHVGEENSSRLKFITINTQVRQTQKKLLFLVNKTRAYPRVHAPPQQHLPQGFLSLSSMTLLPDAVVTSCHSVTVIAWYWPSSAAPREVREVVRRDQSSRQQRESSSWPPALLRVEQLTAHWPCSEDRCFRSGPLLLTWSLSCSGLGSTSDPPWPRLQRSARPPVTSTRASDTCPAHRSSYEPWSLRWIENF